MIGSADICVFLRSQGLQPEVGTRGNPEFKSNILHVVLFDLFLSIRSENQQAQNKNLNVGVIMLGCGKCNVAK